MFKIDGTTIKVNRGDKGNFKFKAPLKDVKEYFKYMDGSNNVYWYDKKNNILYDSTYTESQTSLATLTQQFYEFTLNDVVTLGVYTKKGMDKTSYLLKEITVSEATTELPVSLTSEDTTIGELINKPDDYWYEIQLNKEQTLLGYDDTGAKLFKLYPEGSDLSD